MTKTNRLKELRKSKGYTLDDISKLTGITRGTYNNYENGKTEPKLAVWKQLSEFYGVPVTELMDPEDLMNSVRDTVNSIRISNNKRVANQIQRVAEIIENNPLPQTSLNISNNLDVMLKIFDNSNIDNFFDDYELILKIQEKYGEVIDCLMVLLHAVKDTDEEDRKETNKMISKAELDFSNLLSLLLEAQNKKASDD
ncbi:helix-turn-helix domain-containing protein [Leuconostoc mesenteroides]|uniref:helix-turn-helix domain-containing protein n=1 Tax=Leuconostoc mesenteroides TaxID=1245 RepID=UPI00207453B2|nr:helix-turn-helix domain-containing protein [Leuconostoc mesenteroides]MCM6833761.1 helix-turn-helix domain-containing protein [Leuconostoc mesenteroides]